MNYKYSVIIFFILSNISLFISSNTIYDLRINHIANPFSINIIENNFSFKTDEEGPFNVSIILDDQIIESKEITLSECHSFAFDQDLEYNKEYIFQVQSKSSEAKAELKFETAANLTASFIKPKNSSLFSPIFTKEIILENKTIKKGRLYITGLGLYQAHINEQRVGNFYLTPGFNDYDAYLRYQGYDITYLLKNNSKNLIEVHMGDGWYKGRYGIADTVTGKQYEIWGSEYKLCAQIIIEYSDGNITEIYTNDTWKVKKSKEVSNGIYDGEEIDFTLAEGTEEDVIISQENYTLIPDFGAQIVQKYSLTPELYTSPKGDKILDFKQNMVGFVRYRGNLEKNQELKLTFGEVLQKGEFYNANYRDAKAVLKFKGDGIKRIFEPKFTFYGFRYAKVEGLSNINVRDFEGVVIYTNLDKTIKCETDNKKINQLISNALWSQRGNFLDVPTDCPQRNERLGWTGDAQVFSNTACYNMDSYIFYKKVIKDLRADQELYYNGDFPMWVPSLKKQSQVGGAVWADSGTIIPWNIYMNYGDKKLLEKNYPMITEYVETLIQKDIDQGNKSLILEGFSYGDWLALDGIDEQSTNGGTNQGYIMSIYYYVSVNIASLAAKELGKTEDQQKYDELKERIKAAILDEFHTPNGRLSVDTQTAYILALYYNITRNNETIISGYKDRLMRDAYKLKTGFTGTPLILLTLFDYGLDIDAYRFLFNEKFPGWIYAINLGATTIWERWNSLNEDGSISGTSMNSLNHYAYGSVCEAIYSRIAGLRNLSPGWKKVLIEPHLNYRMKKMNFEYDSISGRFIINWNFDETKFYMNVTIPNGVEANIILPNGTEYDNVTKGEHNFECNLTSDIYSPFTIDTPLFEILENEEGKKIIADKLPMIYYMATGETNEMKYSSLKQYIGLPFVGINEDLLEELDVLLRQIRINVVDDDNTNTTNTNTTNNNITNNDNKESNNSVINKNDFIELIGFGNFNNKVKDKNATGTIYFRGTSNNLKELKKYIKFRVNITFNSSTNNLRFLAEESKIIEVKGERNNSTINNGRIVYDLTFPETENKNILSMKIMNNEYSFSDDYDGEYEKMDDIKTNNFYNPMNSESLKYASFGKFKDTNFINDHFIFNFTTQEKLENNNTNAYLTFFNGTESEKNLSCSFKIISNEKIVTCYPTSNLISKIDRWTLNISNITSQKKLRNLEDSGNTTLYLDPTDETLNFTYYKEPTVINRNKDSSNLSRGAIAAIIIASVVAVAAVVGLLMFLNRNPKILPKNENRVRIPNSSTNINN